MQQRGRKSAAALSVVAGTEIDGRPKPPESLTNRQREIWDCVVHSEPAGQFRSAALQIILAEFCRHTETAERLTEMVDRATDVGSNMPMQELEQLLRCRDRETKALADKATKLRLTNQSRYTPGAAATASKNSGTEKKPWHAVGN